MCPDHVVSIFEDDLTSPKTLLNKPELDVQTLPEAQTLATKHILTSVDHTFRS